ncbi:hypothetical protein SAMN05880553_5423 [Bacillus toyonensis]|nr:hypothetical protein SAMN05880553_5423 [Bacillus toyonensis]
MEVHKNQVVIQLKSSIYRYLNREIELFLLYKHSKHYRKLQTFVERMPLLVNLKFENKEIIYYLFCFVTCSSTMKLA